MSDTPNTNQQARGGFVLKVLKVQSADGPGEDINFAADCDCVRLGRSDDCDVMLADVTVSRHHAEILRTRKGYLLLDSGSANGVWVDDKRVQEHVLTDGQKFRLGAAVVQFSTSPAEDGPAAAPARPAAAQPPAPPTAGAAPPPPPGATTQPPPPTAHHEVDQAAIQREQEAAAREAAQRKALEKAAADREAAAREAAAREARDKEAAQREAAEREAKQKEAAEQAARQREAQAKEAAQREAEAQEAAQHDAEAKKAAEKEAAAQEAARREAEAKKVEAEKAASKKAAEAAPAAAEALPAADAPPAAEEDEELPPDIERAEETALTAELKQHGMGLRADGNRPFLLDGKDTAWFVESGKLEVFTVGLREGKPTGARSHFVTINAGEFMFGMDLEGFAMGSGFLAVGRMGTNLREVSIAKLKELAADARYSEELSQMVDTWVRNLSHSLTEEIIPGPLVDVNLVAGGEETELKNQQKARSNRGVQWLEVVDGNLLFIGMEEILFWQEKAQDQQFHHSIQVNLQDLFAMAQESQSAQVMFPVTTETWIEASNAQNQTTKLKTYAAADVIADPAVWGGLELFHQVLCQCEFINKKLAAVDEFNRLKTKAEYSKAAEEAAYKEIALVMDQPSKDEPVLGPGEETDPIVAGCKLVGEALGMTIVAHPDADRDAKFEDRVEAVAKASQFRVRAIALRGKWWKYDHGPMLGKTDEKKKPIALLPTGPRSYVAIDPATGESRKVNSKAVDELDLDVFGLAFYRPFPDGPVTAKKLFKFGIRGLSADIWTLVFMGAGLGMVGALVPIISGKLFDTAIPQADRGVLVQYTTALFAGALVTTAFKITQSIATIRLQGKMDYSIQAALWDRLLNLPSRFFRNYSAGDLGDRASGINAIRGLIAGAGIAAILGSMSSIFYIILMFVYSVHLGALAMGLTLVFVSFSFSMNFLQLRYQRQMMWIRGRITGLVLQFVSGVGKLRVAGAESHAFRVWAKEYASQRRMEFRIGRIQNNVQIFNSGFPIFSSMAVFFMLMKVQQTAAAAGGPPPLTTGDFIAFNSAYGTFLAAMVALSEASLNLLRAVPIFERLTPIITADAELDETKAYPGTLKGEIELSHVHFRYLDDGPWINDDVSLKIRPGEFVAFVGSSGCGKSTLMRLMLGFETPDKGSVYYDGGDLASLDVREVRQQLGVVLQDSKLLPADIFRNIVGTLDLTIDDAWEAAKHAGLAEDISVLPMGMHTYVSEGGGGFSGGQQQRLLIARALVRKPRIIFMDEATSALDNKSQNVVTESMDRLQATRIVIAHRLSTIINADRICYMDGGKIVEMGNYEELMELGGLFYELARRQVA